MFAWPSTIHVVKSLRLFDIEIIDPSVVDKIFMKINKGLSPSFVMYRNKESRKKI